MSVLGLGRVKTLRRKHLMPSQFRDAADAEAICEAVTRPTMRFVEIKTEEQQSVLMLHRTRQLFVRQRTTLINAIRAHMAEFGIVAGIGRNGVERLLRLIDEGAAERVPPAAQESLRALQTQLVFVKRQILEADRRIQWMGQLGQLGRLLHACLHAQASGCPWTPWSRRHASAHTMSNTLRRSLGLEAACCPIKDFREVALVRVHF